MPTLSHRPAGYTSTHIHIRAYLVFQPQSVPSSFPLLDGFAHRPSAEIFKVFSHTSDPATPITRAPRIRVVVIVQNPSGRNSFSLSENFFDDSDIFGNLHGHFFQ